MNSDQVLLDFLEIQRDVVLDILAGLDEADWQRSILPSGWTPAGLLAHLAGAERHWFQGVVADTDGPQPWDEGRPPYDFEAAFECDRPSAVIIDHYRQQCARAREIVAAVGLSAVPRGIHGEPGMDEPADARWVVLHMIEETARHAGHLDVARELLDGRTGLGPR